MDILVVQDNDKEAAINYEQFRVLHSKGRLKRYLTGEPKRPEGIARSIGFQLPVNKPIHPISIPSMFKYLVWNDTPFCIRRKNSGNVIEYHIIFKNYNNIWPISTGDHVSLMDMYSDIERKYNQNYFL
jgi:hypothetical protein